MIAILLLGCATGVPEGVALPDELESPPLDTADTDPTPRVDGDSDGFSSDDDCDDLDAAVNPAAVEVCNGRDDNCDGLADDAAAEGTRSWYADEDRDGWGTGEAFAACAQPIGYVLFQGDCDDADDSVNPGASERCDGVDTNCTGSEADATDVSSWYPDRDGDGWGALEWGCDRPDAVEAPGDDCDDTRADVHSGAVEVCDGVDQDCDGATDEDAVDEVVWYADSDLDGYGAADRPTLACTAPADHVRDDTDCDDTNDAVTVRMWYADADADGFGVAALSACEEPAGYAPRPGDCDDADPSVNPGETESCDGAADLNCDGSVGVADADADGVVACEDCDDADPTWSDPLDWYLDADHDAYGDSTITLSACYGPAWYVSDASDCDDGDAATHPGATEAWYDDVDEACDGGSDRNTEADGYDAPLDCTDDDSAVNPGASEVCDDGVDNDCDGGAGACARTGTVSLADADARFVGEEAGDSAGSAFASFEDPTASWGRSLAIGGDRAADARGVVWIIRDIKGGEILLEDVDTVLVGETEGGNAGNTLTSPGDLDGDGVTDIVVGSFLESSTETYCGAAYVVSGATPSGSTSLSLAAARIDGEGAVDFAGNALASPGDVDGDGYVDLIVGALRNDEGGLDSGAAYLLFGPINSNRSLANNGAKLIGEEADDMAGNSVSAGDLDGDGTVDMLVGTADAVSGTCSAGGAYVVSGTATGHVDLSVADATVRGAGDEDCLGWSVSTAGDVDADGYADLIVGAIGNSTNESWAGAAHVLRGPLSGASDSDSAAWTVLGTAYLEQVGWTVSNAGDIDQDGYDDVLVGALEGTQARAGQANLYYGPLAGITTFDIGDLRMDGEMPSDYAGTTLAGLGDLDADGFPEFMVGAPSMDAYENLDGAAYLYFGSGM